MPPHLERLYISQGEYAISDRGDQVIATLLGSCVSACLWDAHVGIGGMNHVLFTDETENAAHQFGHGVNGMELLINGLLRKGADRNRLRGKVFGGASMISGLSKTGERNALFVTEFLAREKIAYVGGDVGGSLARLLEFWPVTGRARVKRVNTTVEVGPAAPMESDIELF